MPRWLGRILYAFRGRRRVRLHLEVKPGAPESVEGVLVGRWSGHYVLLLPKVLESPERTVSLDGTLEVPSERVVFVQVLDR
jgi:hypothetical protein